MNIDFVMKTIKRWINIRFKDGYKISGIGFHGIEQIYINFKKKENNDE